MAAIFQLPKPTLQDANGLIEAGGKIQFYNAGTTTPQTIYQDSALSVPHTNPVVGDSAGRLPVIYLTPGTYKIVRLTAGGSVVYTSDNLETGVPIGSGALSVALGGTGGATAAAARSSLGAASAGEVATLSADVAALQAFIGSFIQPIVIAASDENTPITAGSNKVRFRMPMAFTLSAVRASLTTAQATGSILTIDINEGGTTILSTKLTIDNTEKTSTTAAAAAVISDASLANDAEISIDVDQIGDGTATGLKIYLIGIRTP